MRLALPLLLLLVATASPAAESVVRCDSRDKGDGWSFSQSVKVIDGKLAGLLVHIALDAPVTVVPDTGFLPAVSPRRARQPIRGRLVLEVYTAAGHTDASHTKVELMMPAVLQASGAAAEDGRFQLQVRIGERIFYASDKTERVRKPVDLQSAANDVIAHAAGTSDAAEAAILPPEEMESSFEVLGVFVDLGLSGALQLAATPPGGGEPLVLETMPVDHAVVQAATDRANALFGEVADQYNALRCELDE